MKNERYTHSDGQKHFLWYKENIDSPTSNNVKETWNGLDPATDDNHDVDVDVDALRLFQLSS